MSIWKTSILWYYQIVVLLSKKEMLHPDKYMSAGGRSFGRLSGCCYSSRAQCQSNIDHRTVALLCMIHWRRLGGPALGDCSTDSIVNTLVIRRSARFIFDWASGDSSWGYLVQLLTCLINQYHCGQACGAKFVFTVVYSSGGQQLRNQKHGSMGVRKNRTTGTLTRSPYL